MSSADSEVQNIQKLSQQIYKQNFHSKRKKDYICPCGRPYGSYPALYAHIKRKHDGKAPGQIVKPKAIRRRGRPFKYEPVKLQNQNPHKTASKHLEEYLRRVQQDVDLNDYPLKQFADRNRKVPLPNFKKIHEQISKPHLIPSNGHNNINPLHEQLEASMYQFRPRENRNNFPSDYLNPQKKQLFQYRMEEDIRNQYRSRVFPYKKKPLDYGFPNNESYGSELLNLPNYKNFINDRLSLQNQEPIGNQYFYHKFQHEHQNRLSPYQRQHQDYLDDLYSKPFEIILRQEMETKFKPISQGITDFLEPILRQLLNQEGESQCQKPILVEGNSKDKLEKSQLYINYLQDNKTCKQNNISQQQKNQQKQNQIEKHEVKISTLLQNEHFSDILKWLMSPPQEQSVHRLKQNYIEFSFRCCLVQFLDFLHKFLQTIQHQQILLILVFFCDHILAETGSFQLQPQPQIYEIGLYFNKFINEYLPKLMTFMPYLNEFYIFKDFKKKVSELFMWMSSWQAIQQYYHNKYHRQRMSTEISQENYKCMMYQRKYQSYIREATRQHTAQVESLQHVRSQASQMEENQQGEEKTQQNPQITILNPHNSMSSNQEIHLSEEHLQQDQSHKNGQARIEEEGQIDQNQPNQIQSDNNQLQFEDKDQLQNDLNDQESQEEQSKISL